ncbi:hypothetical protein JB92DRAFT_2849286 [Gautieria morchelliformis]|nr:hypothetical protein JB92DRAFT_2849286 [Gautieria morchelliformis]
MFPMMIGVLPTVPVALLPSTELQIHQLPELLLRTPRYFLSSPLFCLATGILFSEGVSALVLFGASKASRLWVAWCRTRQGGGHDYKPCWCSGR